jgi:ribosome-associated protein
MEDLELNHGVVIPAAEFDERFMRSGGPGGQHANKASSKVELSLDISTCAGLSEELRGRALGAHGKSLVTVVAEDSRSQFRNRQIARTRMALRLNALLKPPPKKRRPSSPSRSAKQRRMDAKTRRSNIKKKRGRVTWE